MFSLGVLPTKQGVNEMILKEYRKGDQIFRLIKCDWCKKEVEVEKIWGRGNGASRTKYCSSKCRAKFNRKKLSITNKYKKCLYCRNEFEISKEKKNKKFCTVSCFHSYTKRKTKDIVDSIRKFQLLKLGRREMAERLNISLSKLRSTFRHYKLTLPEDRVNIRNKIYKNKWTQEETLFLTEYLNNVVDRCDFTYLMNHLDRTKMSIKCKIWVIRKQLKQDGWWIN